MNINNFNKKRVLIILAIVSTIFIVIIGFAIIMSVINKQAADKKIQTQRQQWDLGNQEELIKAASIEYFAWDKNESMVSRNERLRKYFTTDSPVYDNPFGSEGDMEGIDKTTGKVVDLKECDEQEGGNLCTINTVEITFYENGVKTTTTSKYWLSINKITDNEFRAYNIGPYIE